MLDLFKEKLSISISELGGIEAKKAYSLLEKPRNVTHGDLAFPCFLLAKEKKISPPNCASFLVDNIKLPNEFDSAEALGPFVNFKFSKEVLAKSIIEEALSFKNAKTKNPQNVIVEYSSPNIAKPFHVGHLRATLIGNCLDRVFRFVGHKTTSINHLGDWGTQFGFVWAGCEIWGTPKEKTVNALVDIYRKATSLKEQQENEKVEEEFKNLPDINEMARNYFLELEEGKTEALKFWQMCVDISLDYLKNTYKRLDVSFDHYTGESFYSDKLQAVETELKEAGLLIESKGAMGVDLGEELGFARIATPDGRSLYLARDLAAAQYRADTFNFDRALYVVGIPQALHFKQIIGVLSALLKPFSNKITHVGFGHVMGMKTRGDGNFIELNEFLDEAFERSLNAYKEHVSKKPEGLDETEVAQAVANAAILFSNLSKTNIKDVHFSWDHALEFQGDSGPYLLYACARISSVEQRVKDSGLDKKFNGEPNFSLLTEESAHRLLLVLSDFYMVLRRTTDDNEPSYLSNYSLEIAKSFSKAYSDLQVIGVEPELAQARLELMKATKHVLKQCLELLGMKTLDRM